MRMEGASMRGIGRITGAHKSLAHVSRDGCGRVGHAA